MLNNITNRIIMDNMNRQCVYNNLEVTGDCPIWLWIMLGILVVGFIGFMVWTIVKTWIW